MNENFNTQRLLKLNESKFDEKTVTRTQLLINDYISTTSILLEQIPQCFNDQFSGMMNL
jgi:hypothetical protein